MTQAGALVVEDCECFLDALKAYEVLVPPKGPRLALLSGQAGPGMVGYDAALKEGLLVEQFCEPTLRSIERPLPPMAIRINPVDLGPLWYDHNALVEVIRKVMEDPNIDAVIFMMMFASANIKSIPAMVEGLILGPPSKPIFTCIQAPSGIWEEEIKEAEINKVLCNFPTPERTVKACANMLKLERLRTKKTKGMKR
jgi:acyl-CoA synthetase (NDP forming)